MDLTRFLDTAKVSLKELFEGRMRFASFLNECQLVALAKPVLEE